MPRVFPATELKHSQQKRIFYSSIGIKIYPDKTIYHPTLNFDKSFAYYILLTIKISLLLTACRKFISFTVFPL